MAHEEFDKGRVSAETKSLLKTVATQKAFPTPVPFVQCGHRPSSRLVPTRATLRRRRDVPVFLQGTGGVDYGHP